MSKAKLHAPLRQKSWTLIATPHLLAGATKIKLNLNSSGATQEGGPRGPRRSRAGRQATTTAAAEADSDYDPAVASASDDEVIDLADDEDVAMDELESEDEDGDWDDDPEGEGGAAGGGSSRAAKKGGSGSRGGRARPRSGGAKAPSAGRKPRQRRGGGAAAPPSRRKRRPSADDEAAFEDIDLEAEFDSDAEPDDNAYVLGAADEEFQDFSTLQLKNDHPNRPLWVCPDGRIFLETFSPVYKQAYDFLIAVAEPVSRPNCIHEYMLTPHSLYAAVSIGLETSTIVSVLDRLSKARLPPDIKRFVRDATENYGKVKLVLQQNKFFVESPYPEVLKRLLKDATIQAARVAPAPTLNGTGDADGGFVKSRALKDRAVDNLASVQEIDLTGGPSEGPAGKGDVQPMDTEGAGETSAGPSNAQTTAEAVSRPSAFLEDVAAEEDPDKELLSFEIQGSQVEHVKARCLPGGLNYPMLEEYDFRGDTTNPTLNFELKPHVKVRRRTRRVLAFTPVCSPSLLPASSFQEC